MLEASTTEAQLFNCEALRVMPGRLYFSVPGVGLSVCKVRGMIMLTAIEGKAAAISKQGTQKSTTLDMNEPRCGIAIVSKSQCKLAQGTGRLGGG